MAKTQLKLSIPTPCSEDWNTMTPDKNGKFCASCQKTVIDFSAMTDAQIIHYFTDFQGETCGRLTEKQLNAVIAEPLILKPNNRWAWALSALLLPTVAASQTVKTTPQNVVFISSVASSLAMTSEAKSLVGTDFLTIEGEVNELGGSFLPVDGAIVAVNINDKIVAYAQTDSLGIFSLNLPKSYDNQRFSLDISQIGFEKEQLFFDDFKAIKDNRLFISLKNTPIAIEDAVICTAYGMLGKIRTYGGAISVITYNKVNIFQRTKYFFRNLFRKKRRD
jgi:hypothetical protein